MDPTEQQLQELWTAVNERLQTIDFTKLWPGYKRYPYALYNAASACVDGEVIPKPEEFLANTAVRYRDGWTAIFMVDGSEDPDIMASKMVHEMFHAFQRENGETRFPNELQALIHYQYTADNLQQKFYENRLLTRLHQGGDDNTVWAQLLASRKQRHAAFPDSYVYEAKIEQIEGPAEYVELQSLRQLNPDLYEAKLEKMLQALQNVNALFPIRIGLYASGALLLKYLDDHGIAFDCGFSETPFAVSLLDEADELQVDVPVEPELDAALEKYRAKQDKTIARLTAEEPVVEGSFQLLGLNVYDAWYHDRHMYTTYFLMYQDGEEQKMLQGNYLIEVDGLTVKKVYADE